MDNRPITNGYLTHAAGQLSSGSKLTGQDGPSMSAMLMDPRGPKNPSSNGNPSFTTCRNMDSECARHNSEPPLTFAQPNSLMPGDSSSISKDDAHTFIEGHGRGSRSSKPQAASQPQQGFNPLQLLDPKGAASSQPRPNAGSLSRSSPSRNGAYKRASEEPEAQGMGNLIERIHGITQRDGCPQKRQKTTKTDEDDDGQRKATFAGGGKGGEIGEYMREKRKEAQAESGPNGTVVDLTAGTAATPM